MTCTHGPAKRSVRWKYTTMPIAAIVTGMKSQVAPGRMLNAAPVLRTCHSWASEPMTSTRSPKAMLATTSCFVTWSAAYSTIAAPASTSAGLIDASRSAAASTASL